MNAEEDYFEINEIENLIDNLEMVAHFLEATISYKWKWASMALHQALYGGLICTLQGSDARQTVVDRQKDTGKAVMLHVYKTPIDVIASSFGRDEETIRNWLGNPYLITLDEALRRVKRKECLPALANAKPLVTTAEEDAAIHRLSKEFRNQFEHFSPKAWMVQTSLFPPVASSIFRIVRFLVLESNCVTLSSEQEQRIKRALTRGEDLLSS